MNIKKYQWKYRILLIETPNYINDNYKNTKNIYEEHIKEFHKRHVKLISFRKKNTNFIIKLIGFDGKIKKQFNKIKLNSLFEFIDNMPINKKASPKNLSLFSDYNKKTTIPGLGFKDKDKALYTIQKIKDKPLKYQKSVINTMLGRAKNHPHLTKGMLDAIKIFEKWLKKN